LANKRALIVDDEPDIRELLEITLGRMNIDTTAAENVTRARELLDRERFDLCLTDMRLPDGSGLDLVAHITEELPHLPVAVITAHGSMDTAISALKAGAFDFVQKPVDLEQLRTLVDAALRLTPEPRTETRARLTGVSKVMDDLRAQIHKISRSQAPIYISGESGSGKEVAARLIHELGPRGEGPFVPVNCGAIPGELMESEFFGHTRGSFTGAVADKQGLFQAAECGTLFLDEVADLPLSMQVKLLRAIQEKAVRAVGAATETPIDVRVLSATHRDLAAEVAAGRFRQDLYFRLNVIELRVPSLRERPGDIAALAEQVLTRIATDYGADKPVITDEAMRALTSYPFPGNVRELENTLERAFTLCEGGRIEIADLKLAPAGSTEHVDAPGSAPTAMPAATGFESAAPPASAATAEPLPEGTSLEQHLVEIERKLITEALEATRWNKTAAARNLGITFRALRYRLKKLGLE
jgi:two-component system response regulator PilR (NtrC family)